MNPTVAAKKPTKLDLYWVAFICQISHFATTATENVRFFTYFTVMTAKNNSINERMKLSGQDIKRKNCKRKMVCEVLFVSVFLFNATAVTTYFKNAKITLYTVILEAIHFFHQAKFLKDNFGLF